MSSVLKPASSYITGWARYTTPESPEWHGLRAKDHRWFAVEHDGPSTLYNEITPPPTVDALLVKGDVMVDGNKDAVQIIDAGGSYKWLCPRDGYAWAQTLYGSKRKVAVVAVYTGHHRTGVYKWQAAIDDLSLPT